MSDARRIAALLALAAVPWTVYRVAGWNAVGLVFPWGLLDTAALQVVTTWAYVFDLTGGPPAGFLAWPVSALLYGLAVANAVAGIAVGREDRRVTGGLLVLAGASNLAFVLAFSRQNPTAVTVPVGTVSLWAVAWWFHGRDLRRAVHGPVVEP